MPPEPEGALGSPAGNTEEGTQQGVALSPDGERLLGMEGQPLRLPLTHHCSRPVLPCGTGTWESTQKPPNTELWPLAVEAGLKTTTLSATCKAPEFPTKWRVKPLLPAVLIDCLLRYLSADWAPRTSALKLLFHTGSQGDALAWVFTPSVSAKQ